MSETLSARVLAQVAGLRRAKGWTQPEFAEHMAALGIPWDRSIVANVEAGRRGTCSVDELYAIGAVFGIPPHRLVATTCSSCADQPPPGFTCNACDRRA